MRCHACQEQMSCGRRCLFAIGVGSERNAAPRVVDPHARAAQQATADEAQRVGAKVDAAAVVDGSQAQDVAEALAVQLEPLQRGVLDPEARCGRTADALQGVRTRVTFREGVRARFRVRVRGCGQGQDKG